YEYSRLEYKDHYTGHKQSLTGSYQIDHFNFTTNSSVLSASGRMYNTDFIRSKSQAIYQKNKNWAGSRLDLEDYRVKEVQTQYFSQRFQSTFILCQIAII